MSPQPAMDGSDRAARQIAALAELGFQQVEAAPMASESVRVGRDRFKVTGTRPAMGTLVSLTTLTPSLDQAQEAMGLSFREMDRLVDLLNRYDTSSALSCLNSEGAIKEAPPELTDVTSQARLFHRISNGAFDVTVQPLVDLFRSHSAWVLPDPFSAERPGSGTHSSLPPRPPTEGEVREVLERVDGSALEVERRSIRLGKPGMGVTLDGIAKGYIVDGMAQVLANQGIADYLINAGGDIRSAGTREDGEPWRVGVQDPGGDQGFPDIIRVSGGAVATSGSYEIYFDRDRTYHHIVSSRTGASPQSSRSVSVLAPTAMVADALATSVFVMGPKRGMAFIDSLPRCACLIVDPDGRQVRSRRWGGADSPQIPKAGA